MQSPYEVRITQPFAFALTVLPPSSQAIGGALPPFPHAETVAVQVAAVAVDGVRVDRRPYLAAEGYAVAAAVRLACERGRRRWRSQRVDAGRVAIP
jgi:hypothetical protein